MAQDISATLPGVRPTAFPALALLTLFLVLTAGREASASTPEWPDVERDAASVGGGELDAAVVVGVDKYTYLPTVPGAATNAAAWQQWFLRVRKVPFDRVITLKDEEATKEKIERGLKTAAGQVQPGAEPANNFETVAAWI